MSANVPRTRGRAVRWMLTAAVAILCGVYFLNLPFYWGFSTGSTLWRMEHGRLLVECGDYVAPQSFYVAVNSEGLRFRPEFLAYNWKQWFVFIPLWLPIAALSALLVTSIVRERRRRRNIVGRCANCDYDTRGLTRCPECGAEVPPRSIKTTHN